MYKATFAIVNPSDLKYTIWMYSISIFVIGMNVLALYLDLENQYFNITLSLSFGLLILLKILRFFFRDIRKIGELTIYSDGIEIETKNETKKISKPRQILFLFKGCFGENNLTSQVVIGAFNSGRKNVISITDSENNIHEMNIYLHNDFEKNKLDTILKQLAATKGCSVHYI